MIHGRGVERFWGHDQSYNIKEPIILVGPINFHHYENTRYMKNILHFENNGIFIIKTTFTHLWPFQDSGGTNPKIQEIITRKQKTSININLSLACTWQSGYCCCVLKKPKTTFFFTIHTLNINEEHGFIHT
jgi:hypothetical protein